MRQTFSMIEVRAARPADEAPIADLHGEVWGGQTVVGHATVYDLSSLPTLVAVDGDGTLLGALAYQIADEDLEVVSIAASTLHAGVGTALLAAAVDVARHQGLCRVWLVTTNDNLDALRFYQRRGMRIVGVSPGAVERSRAVKPSIPHIGAYGIPLRDELTLELTLSP